MAGSLIGLGVQAGDRVGVLMTNHPDLVLSVFGASLVGAVVVPINARYRTSELRFIVEDAQLPRCSRTTPPTSTSTTRRC